MSTETNAPMLRIEDKIKAEDALYLQMSHNEDKKIVWIALGVAVVLHVAILIVNFPDFKKIIPPKKTENVIVVKKYVPPPPEVKRKVVKKEKLTKKVPIPDPTPDEPEPIREPEPEIEPEPMDPDVDFVIGIPDAPPPTGPLIAGSGDVTNPVKIEELCPKPEYPELARVARLEGNVILQAVIQSDGSVGQVEVLRCTRPGMGFEDSAIHAVQQWRYEPALQGDRPVDVYFTVVVEFQMH